VVKGGDAKEKDDGGSKGPAGGVPTTTRPRGIAVTGGKRSRDYFCRKVEKAELGAGM